MAVAIATRPPYSVAGTSGHFHGFLVYLDGQASIDCYFQYRIKGSATWSDTSAAAETLTNGGDFYSAEITLTADETYEVRTVAEWDDGGTQNAYGDTIEFETTWQTEYGKDFEAGTLTNVEGELGELTLSPDTYSSNLCADMTNYNAPSPNLVWHSNRVSTTYTSYKAFDRNTATFWAPTDSYSTPEYIWYSFYSISDSFGVDGSAYSEVIRKYTLTYTASSANTCRDWKFQGYSFYGWVDLAEEVDISWTADTLTFYVPKNYGYWAFRFYITDNNGGSQCNIREITLHEIATYQTSGTRISPPIDINSLGSGDTMPISWTATTPTYTDITIETAVTGESTITDEAVGTGDGTETVFTLDYYPVTRLDDLVVEVDGTPTTSYSISGKTITFDTAPGNTLAVTASYTGIDEPGTGDWSEITASGNNATLPATRTSKHLWIRQTLETTDDTVTPTLSGVTVEHVEATTYTVNLSGKVVIKNSTTNLLDGSAVLQSDDTDLLDGKGIISSAGTELLDGKSIISSAGTNLLDGLAEVAFGTAVSNLFDGKTIIQSNAINLLDGKGIVLNDGTVLLDGKAIIRSSSTDTLDGKGIISSITTDLLDGTVYIYLTDADTLDGKAVVLSSATGLLDGKAQFYIAVSDLLDGKAVISSESTNFLDGKGVVLSDGANLIDGKGVIWSAAALSLDGKATIRDAISDLLNGKAVIKSVTATQLDGLIVIQNDSTGTFDGKTVIKSSAELSLDGKATIKDIASDLLDGSVTVQLTTSQAFDGRVIIRDAVAGLLDGKATIKDETTIHLDGTVFITLGTETNFFDGKVILRIPIVGKVTVSFEMATPTAGFTFEIPGATFTIE